MPVLTIRDVPEDLHRLLRDMAARNRRSLQQQVLLLLERARALDGPNPAVEAAAIRTRLEGRELGDTIAELNADRRR